MNKTVHYALVALWEKSGCKIVADYPADRDPAYRAIVLSTVNDMKTLEDDKISVDRDKYILHVLIGELHYACLTLKSDCPSLAIQLESCSQALLEKLRSIYRELPMLVDLSRDLTSRAVMDFSKLLKKMIEDYNKNVDFEDPISRMEKEFVEIRRAMMDAIQKLIDRGERLDELLRKTQSLEISSRKDFHMVRNSRKKKRKKKVVTAIGAAILMFILTSFIFVILKYQNIL